MSKFRQIVSIEWDGDDDLNENWLCPDNVAMCIAGFCAAKNVVVRRYPDSPLPSNVREIVVDYLKRKGYGGLYWESSPYRCQCKVGDANFMACTKCANTCRPGVLVDGKIVEREG